MINAWFSGLSGLVKLGLILAILTTAVGAAHWYNAGLIEQGRAEVAADWSVATEAQRVEFEAGRLMLEKAKVALAKKYFEEKNAREKTQLELDKEREAAILAGSAVARLECFTPGMQLNWDRTSGHGGAAAAGETGRGVAPTVR